jgi:hypothetical protein
MSDSSSVVVYGNSHIECIIQSEEDKTALTTLRIRDPKDEDVPTAATMADFTKMVADLPEDALVAISYFGTQHNVLGLVNHGSPFSLIGAWENTANEPSPELIPEHVLAASLRAHYEKNNFVKNLSTAACCRIVHIMAPPPKEDLSRFVSKKAAYRGQSIADFGYSAPARRLAFWTLEKEVIERYLQSLGFLSLAVPPETLTPEGFLKPEYSMQDVTHANPAYGALIVQQLRELAASR